MEIVLHTGEIICIDGNARNLTVTCRSGRLWITQTGDPNDYTIVPGEQFIITRKGKIAVTALGDACVRFTSAVELKQACRPWQIQAA